jgi:Flp pilus assembly pilin Flp
MSEANVSIANDRVPHSALKISERGASLVEYSLLIALIALVTIGGVRAIGTASNNQFLRVNTALSTAG